MIPNGRSPQREQWDTFILVTCTAFSSAGSVAYVLQSVTIYPNFCSTHNNPSKPKLGNHSESYNRIRSVSVGSYTVPVATLLAALASARWLKPRVVLVGSHGGEKLRDACFPTIQLTFLDPPIYTTQHLPVQQPAIATFATATKGGFERSRCHLAVKTRSEST